MPEPKPSREEAIERAAKVFSQVLREMYEGADGYDAALVEAESEMTDEDREIRDRLAAAMDADPLLKVSPTETIVNGLLDSSGSELLLMAKVVAASSPRVIVDVVFGLTAIAKRARRVGL